MRKLYLSFLARCSGKRDFEKALPCPVGQKGDDTIGYDTIVIRVRIEFERECRR